MKAHGRIYFHELLSLAFYSFSIVYLFILLPVRKNFIKLNAKGPILECREKDAASAFLFYPGTMIEPGHYSLFLDALYYAGFSVYALHLAGHGKNSKTKIQTFEYMLEEGLTAQDWIVSNKSRTVFVGGHSQGGICTLAHGARTATPAALFPICACLPQLKASISITRFGKFAKKREQILGFLQKGARYLPNLPIPLPLYLSGSRILASYKTPILTGKGKTRISYPIKFLYSLFSSRISEKMLSPLWLMGAKDDRLFTEQIIEELYHTLSAPRKSLVWLPTGGHLAILNPWLARYAAALCACICLSLGQPLNSTNI